MSYLEYKKGDFIEEHLEVLDFREGGLGRVYFCFCHQRQIKTIVKTIKKEIWEKYNLSSRYEFIRDVLMGKKPIGKRIDLAEYFYLTFFREARLICQAQDHPNVLRGSRIWWTKNGQPFFECEFIKGAQDLNTFYQYCKEQTGKGLSPLEVIHLAVSFCNGMMYVSEEMIKAYNELNPEAPATAFVHRDIKPHNILLTKKNQIKIIDFGLAKFIVPSSLTQYMSYSFIGTPKYMSPEQRTNYEFVTPASDIYSFGVTLYELLDGKMPLLENALEFPDYVPEELQSIVKKCLKYNPNQRFQSFRELREALVVLIKKIKAGEVKIKENLRCISCGFVDTRRKELPSEIKTMVYRGHKMVKVPAGPFYKGLSEDQKRKVLKKYNREDIRRLFDDEKYQKVELPAFWIDIYPVTNEQYYRFIKETGYRRIPSHWKDWGFKEPPYPPEKANYPVTNVSYRDALAYCEWAGLRLPTGDEWEKAARGIDGRLYPWGDEYNSNFCNSAESGNYGPVAVDRYPEGKSPYGCYQMVGNVFEWVNEPHPRSSSYKWLRGGSWAVSCELLGLPCLHYIASHEESTGETAQRDIFGFRCAKDAEPEEEIDSTIPEKERCPLCGGSLILFKPSEIKVPERNIYTWIGFFDI